MSPVPLQSWKGRRVRSGGDDAVAAARKVPETPRSGSLFFIPSPLEGWGVDVLLDRLPADSAVVVFEKDIELEAFLSDAWNEVLGDRVRHPRLFRLRTDSETAVQELFGALPQNSLRRVEFLPLNGAWLPNGARYRAILQRLDEGVKRWWSNRITSMHLGGLWIKNLFANLTSDRFSLEPWPHWGTDTVLVCGAGPTLDKALPWAHAHRDRLRIVAADTALGALKPWNIVPDAVVAVESQHANLDDFSGWNGAPVTLFADLTSFPPATRVFSTPPCWFVSEFAPLRFWSRWPKWGPVPVLPPLGSVGVLAAQIGWTLTRGSVILAGLDFSFLAGKSHARGTPPVEAVLRTSSRLNPVGQPVWSPEGWATSPVLATYSALLADRARPHADRVWVWEPAGAELGLKPWPRATLLDKLSHRGSPSAGPHLAQAFVAGERTRWTEALDAFERINNDPSEDHWRALEAALAEIDYLTFDFPDPEFRRESDWLVRAKNRVVWISQRFAG
jgi:hypothetical protein